MTQFSARVNLFAQRSGQILTLSLCTLLSTVVAQTPTSTKTHDYPTMERVRFVLSCLQESSGEESQRLHQCVCTFDAVAKQLTLDQYIEASTVLRTRAAGGERAGVFRDADSAKAAAKKYNDAMGSAQKSCAPA